MSNEAALSCDYTKLAMREDNLKRNNGFRLLKHKQGSRIFSYFVNIEMYLNEYNMMNVQSFLSPSDGYACIFNVRTAYF